ncbi:MAG: PAS domain S-box protein, partial [Bacteroidota bacterium]
SNRDITQRVRAEEELKQSEVFAENLLDTANTIIVTLDTSAMITRFNKYAEVLTGYKKEKVIGKNWFDIFIPEKEHIKAVFLNVLNSMPEASQNENIILTKSREKRLINWRNNILLDNYGNLMGILSIGVDITKQKNAEEELRKSEEKFKSVVKSMDDIVFVIDKDNRFVSVNCESGNLYLNPDEFIGKTHSEIMPKYLDDLYVKAMINVRNGKNEEYEYHLKMPNGINWYALKLSPIFNKGSFDGSVSVVRDITERKQVEKEIQNQYIELAQRNEDLDAFSHTVAHDLKNPISSMMGFADLLHDGYKELSYEEIEKYSHIIIQSGYKTQRIINGLLLFANVSTDKVHIEEVNMHKIVSDALFHFSSQIEKTNAEIKLPTSWPCALGNRLWLNEVWANYISNAIKYGGFPPQIEIGCNIVNPDRNNKPMVRFWVKDNGKGLSVEDQKIVFNKFERLDNIDIKGHGLGLSIAKRIIEKLGGEVGLESSMGEGSLFYFTLPLAPNIDIANKQVKKHTTVSSSSKLKILIAEDEFASKKLLELLLQDISRKTFIAKNGEEAVEVFKNNPDIDLVIMDIGMPIMNGYDATRQIRKLSKDVIIIAHTALTLSNEDKKAIEAGCNEIIRKPLNRDELLSVIYKFTNIRSHSMDVNGPL